MKPRARTQLLLAAVAAALGAYIVFVDRHQATTDQARAARVQLFPGFARDDVREIEIDGGARGRVKASHPGELIDALDIAEIDREATVDARAAGLEPPAARVTITLSSRHLALDLGAVDASGRGVFVRRDSEPRVWVTGRHLRDLIDRELARDAGGRRDP